MKKLICILFSIVACLTLFGGCVFFDGGVKNVPVVADLKYAGGQVENCGERQYPVKGLPYTVKATDTDEYVFWYWEKDGENVSEKKSYTFIVEEATKLLAVFKPKAENKVLINTLYHKPEGEEFRYSPENYMTFDAVAGDGYYTIGESVTLRSGDYCDMGIRRFTVDGQTVDGPALQFIAEKTVTIDAYLERSLAITVEDSPNCTLNVYTENDNKFLKVGDTVRLECIPDDGYVMDQWREGYRDFFGNESRYLMPCENGAVESLVYNGAYVYEFTISENVLDSNVELYLSAVCTNENLEPVYEVEIISEDGSTATVIMPEQKIIGRDYLAYVELPEDTYIQDIYLQANEYNIILFKYIAFFDFYKVGGKVYVTDISDGFEGEKKLVIRTIKKSNAAVIRITSDDEEVMKDYEAGKRPILPIVPNIEDVVIVAKKGKSFYHYYRFERGMQAIYEMGYQFAGVVNEKGEKVLDHLNFKYTATKDEHLHIRYEKKPVVDPYFDYALTEDGTGYVAWLSQVARFSYVTERVSEVTLPATYNGKPVKEIADYGMSQYMFINGVSDAQLFVPFSKINLPETIEKIGKKAFAGYAMEVYIPETATLSYISPDAFYSTIDGVKVNLTKENLNVILCALHEKFIGENDNFKAEYYADEHFTQVGELGHYETFAEYICIKESALGEISAYELSLFYHEFAHHYQIVAMYGVEDETLDGLLIKPTQEEVTAWKEEYNKDDYTAYWNHPMEVWARAFALEWTGFSQG